MWTRFAPVLTLWSAFAMAADAPAVPVQPVVPDARAVAADRLHAAEARSGPESPEVIVPVIDLAAALLAAGDVDGSAASLGRASGLLDRYPEQDRALRLRVMLLQSDGLVRLGRLGDSNAILYKALDLANNATTIGPLERANVLERLAANEGRRGRLVRASAYVGDALELRKEHFGADSPEYAAALLRAAEWYRYSLDFRREVAAEKQAVAILERKFGARDQRLAIPLIRIATARIAQRSQRDDAISALDRAMALDFSPDPDAAFMKAEVLATQADLQLVFGRPEDATPIYVRSWKTIASHDQLGTEPANQYFSRVRQLYVSVPDVIANIGMIDLRYTVTPMGTVDDVHILNNSVPASDAASLGAKSEAGAAMWAAMRRSRYRPRIVNAEPVATPDLSFSSEFCMDPTEFVPICKGSANASAVR